MPDDDLTTEIPPPHETDGPQQPVEDDELEQEQHPSVPADQVASFDLFEVYDARDGSTVWVGQLEGVD